METPDRCVDSITAHLPFLADFPYAGPYRHEFGQGRRSFPVGQYLIVYSFKDEVLILRVIYG